MSDSQNIFFPLKIPKELNIEVTIETQYKENEEIKTKKLVISKIDEINEDKYKIQINLCKIDNEIILNQIKLQISIKIKTDSYSSSIKIKELKKNNFLFDVFFIKCKIPRIDEKEKFAIYKKYLQIQNLELIDKRNITEIYVELILKQKKNINTKILLDTIFEIFQSNEFEILMKIFLEINYLSFDNINEKEIEKLINILEDENFNNKIKQSENSKDIFFNINLILSILYIKIEKFDKYHEKIFDSPIEILGKFLEKINEKNIYHNLTINDLLKILKNINSKNKDNQIPTLCFELLISLLKNNQEKINLIFNQKKNLLIYLNDSLRKRMYPKEGDNEPIPDIKENSINIQKIFDFTLNTEEENENDINIFLENIKLNFFKEYEEEKILRYIFYFDIEYILNNLYEKTEKYKNLKLIIEISNILNDSNNDECSIFDELIENCEKKKKSIFTRILNNDNLIPEVYFSEIKDFFENSNFTSLVFENNECFYNKINKLSYESFMNLDIKIKRILFEIPNNLLNYFIENKLKELDDIKKINDFYSFFEKEKEKEKITDESFCEINNIFGNKINQFLKKK